VADSANSLWRSLMPVRTLGLKRNVFGRPAELSVPHAPHRTLRPKQSLVDVSSQVLNAKGWSPTGTALDRLLVVKCNSKADERERRAESVVCLAQFLKRIGDLVLSTVVLFLVWPLLLVIAIAIKLESSGPVIYRSLRAGKDGRKFDCYKFRTMIVGSDVLKEGLRGLNQRRGPFFKVADDPRVTRLGRFLRKYSVDELPQLWNVLKGDMSLVGPRPHPVEDCARYSVEDCRRLAVKPGVTGLWQVLARANPSFEICMLLDLVYIEKWSLLLDCKILMKTIPAVFAGEGQ